MDAEELARLHDDVLVLQTNVKGQGQGRAKISVKAGETAKAELTLKAGGKKKPA